MRATSINQRWAQLKASGMYPVAFREDMFAKEVAPIIGLFGQGVY
ncbi:MAG TPA: hypothetical protein VNX46_08830 [Candidatus Acidoferrum sp.]|nr:hypothetical protein [Candidatus Acidoferrum sp.]